MRKLHTYLPAVLIVVALCAMIGTSLILFRGSPASSSRTTNRKISVVASFYPLYYFASRIGGDSAVVTNVTPAAAEPHDYEPTAQDVAAMEDSKMVILLGTGLESWGSNIGQNLDPKRTLVITVGQDLMTQRIVENGQDITDPHVWLSPPLAKNIVDKIADGYVKIDPAHEGTYRANANGLKNDLDALDADYRAGLANCAKKDIITSHAAFGYLAKEFGLNQVPIAGLSPDAEPSPKDMADIVTFAKKNKVDIIFFESLVSPKLSQTIATEIGAKTMVLDPIEGITADDLAKGANYFSLMRNNLANLQIALQCHM